MFKWMSHENAPYVDSVAVEKIHTSEIGNLFGPVSETDAYAAGDELTRKKIVRIILTVAAVVLPIVLLCVATIPWTTTVKISVPAVHYKDGVRLEETVELGIDGKAKNYLITRDAFDAKLLIGEDSHWLTDEVETEENAYYTNVLFYDGDHTYSYGKMAFNEDMSILMICDERGEAYLVSPEQELDLQQAEEMFPLVYDIEDTAK